MVIIITEKFLGDSPGLSRRTYMEKEQQIAMSEFYAEKPKQYYSYSRLELLPFVPSVMERVLDVGCSEGMFGKLLLDEKRSKEVWGIEPFEKAAIVAAQHLDKVIQAPVEEALKELPDNSFDAIFFNDVLEHLVDPYTLLSQIKAKLKVNGIVLASLPNILHLETWYKIFKNKDWKYEDGGILDKTHLRYFTIKSAVRMFEEAGYKVEIAQGIHPYYGNKFRLLRFFLGKRVEDMRYFQLVVRAIKN